MKHKCDTEEMVSGMLQGQWPADTALKRHDASIYARAAKWLEQHQCDGDLFLAVKLNHENGAPLVFATPCDAPTEPMIKAEPDIVFPVTELDAGAIRRMLAEAHGIGAKLAYYYWTLSMLSDVSKERGIRLAWLRSVKYFLRTNGRVWGLCWPSFELVLNQERMHTCSSTSR